MSGTPPDSPEVEEGSPFGGAECDDSSPEPAQQVSVDHDLGNVNEFPFVNVSVELYGSHKSYSNVKAEQNYLETNEATPRSPDVENIETTPDLYLHMNDDEGPDNNNSDAYETIVVKSEPFEPDYQNPKKISPEDLQYILPNDCEELRLPVGSRKLPMKYSFSTIKNSVKEVSLNPARKRKRDPTTWKRNKAKVLRVDNKAAERSRVYREKHREEINRRRRDIRQRKKNSQLQILSDIPKINEMQPITLLTSNNQRRSNSHTQRQRRYYERHKEEINKRKRDSRLQKNSPQPIPTTAAERSRKYRERNRQKINEQRRYSRHLQQNVQRVHTECNINIIESKSNYECNTK